VRFEHAKLRVLEKLAKVLKNNTSFFQPVRTFFSSNSQYELQSGEFAPDGRELSALKPENSPPLAGCFRADFQNENCWFFSKDLAHNSL